MRTEMLMLDHEAMANLAEQNEQLRKDLAAETERANCWFEQMQLHERQQNEAVAELTSELAEREDQISKLLAENTRFLAIAAECKKALQRASNQATQVLLITSKHLYSYRALLRMKEDLDHAISEQTELPKG